MKNKIVSFGDSFIYGAEIEGNDNGHRAWPGLVAQRLGVDYETRAVKACGNENIARQIYTYFSENPAENTLAVINWTWCMRWDFYLTDTNYWTTVGPTCQTWLYKEHITETEAQRIIDFYKDYTGRGDQWNLYRSLQAIYGVQCFLRQHNIKAIQTYIDPMLTSSGHQGSRIEHYEIYKDPAWPVVANEYELDTLPEHILNEVNSDYNSIGYPKFITSLQKLIAPELENFEGRSFLEWSRTRGFTITPPPGDHPLEEAHESAADLWQSRYAQALGI